jgi:DNA-directed RNA polymerase subunit K/omega
MASYEHFVSTEECVEATGRNKYEVAVLVAKRSRELASGLPSVLPATGCKNINVALAEVASGELDLDALNARLLKGIKNADTEDPHARSAARTRQRFGGPVANNKEPEDELESLRNSIMAAVAAHKSESGNAMSEAERLFSGDGGPVVSYAKDDIEDPDED